MNRTTKTPRREFLQQTFCATAMLGLAPGIARGATGAEPTPKALSFPPGRHPVTREHPRLFGSRAELQALAREGTRDYERVVDVARKQNPNTPDYAWMMSAALVSAIEQDAALAGKVRDAAMTLVKGPVRVGHVTFGTDLALCGVAFDLCQGAWSDSDQRALCDYVNRTVDANVNSETHVFHNAWYGYKNWGIGVAGYACYHENERAPAFLRTLEDDYRLRAAPALELAGKGGGWAEGYYIHYWLYEWLVFCEVARGCEGVDYYALAPGFYNERAIASVFECYPGIGEYRSRRCIPMGDGGGRLFGGDRDKTLSARRILVRRFREDARHQSAHAFNEITPRSAVGNYAYKDFLWREPGLAKRDIKELPLSHYSSGPGYVFARSSWDDDATHFFFKCGDRFTAHQHLDVNHFLIWKHAELAGDGGHYDDFGSAHDVNYHLRSMAHNTVLVLDPAERWPGIRGGQVSANDGGQHHNWRHHNGALADPEDWARQKAECDIADLLAFEDTGDYVYVAGDATRAYSPKKLACFTRQIVYLRPDTFVIFDRVTSTKPEFRKTWLLQAMSVPTRSGPHLVVTNGKGRLFMQTLLPEKPDLRLVSGNDLYWIDGQSYAPRRDTGAAPVCRVEVSPEQAAAQNLFLHVLTTADAERQSLPSAQVQRDGDRVRVRTGTVELEFLANRVGGAVVTGDKTTRVLGLKTLPALSGALGTARPTSEDLRNEIGTARG